MVNKLLHTLLMVVTHLDQSGIDFHHDPFVSNSYGVFSLGNSLSNGLLESAERFIFYDIENNYGHKAAWWL